MIAVLDQNTIDKIAAGEVIERPASIVKELLENSIDSLATSITVEIKDGGCSLIRVTDNGCGIEKEEIKTAFLRHATSKIKDDKDLMNIHTLGFRGEALSSICAVSRAEIITKTRKSLTGVRYCIEGGISKEFEDIGAPDGTTIIIRDVFFNTPARKKFLKSNSTEAAYISDLIEKIALSHTDIAIRFINNNQTRLQTSGKENIKDIVYQIYGKETANNILNIDFISDNIKISGVIGKANISKANRSMENYFVNGRYIKSKMLSRAIEEAYGNRLMQRQYPFTILYIELNPNFIDVNVHPNKMDIRFSEPDKIYKSIYEAIFSVLSGAEMIPKVNPENRINTKDFDLKVETFKSESETKKNSRPPEPFEIVRSNNYKFDFKNDDKENSVQYSNSTYNNNIYNNKEDNDIVSENISSAYSSEYTQLKLLDGVNIIKHRIVGQIFNTYWIIEFDNNMYIIDQHAAHEKILYEKFINKLKTEKISSQFISPPIILELTNIEMLNVHKYSDILNSMGFEIEDFGLKEIKVSAIPYILPSISKKELIKEIIEALNDFSNIKETSIITEKIASMSCKAAVKGNQRLSYMEIDSLIDELLRAQNPYSCPHGRPTIIKMSKTDIEKKFKRII